MGVTRLWRNMYITGDLPFSRSFLSCSSVGINNYPHATRIVPWVEFVGAISVLCYPESERCGTADIASGSGPLQHPTTTLAICAVTVCQFPFHALPSPPPGFRNWYTNYLDYQADPRPVGAQSLGRLRSPTKRSSCLYRRTALVSRGLLTRTGLATRRARNRSPPPRSRWRP